MCIKKIEIKKISKNSDKVISNLEQDNMDVYEFLKNRFRKCDVRSDSVFQFVFRSFYSMDRAGLTPAFKKEYFRLMQEYRKKNFDIEKILKRLGDFKSLKGLKTVQFSFVTKMYNIIDENQPIYDRYIARVFGFRHPQGDFDKRIEKMLGFYKRLEQSYNEVLQNGTLDSVIKKFDKKFKNNKLSQMKKLDFIFWSAGKQILIFSK